MGNEKLISDIEVQITDCDAGWLFFHVIINKKKIEVSFSHVWDATPDLKSWLEAICVGVQQASFIANEEGYFKKFQFTKIDKSDINLFSIRTFSEDDMFEDVLEITSKISHNENDITLLEKDVVFVNTNQLVQAFYKAFITFSKSDRYKILDWERYSFLIYLFDKNLEKNEKALVERLALLSIDKIEMYFTLIGKWAELDSISSLGLIERLEIYNAFWTDSEIVKKIIESNNYDRYTIHKDFNIFNDKQKRKYLSEYLNENMNPFGGMQLKKFNSEIIENYLKLNGL